MPLRPEYRAFVIELFEEFGPVAVRPMFGAAGIFADDDVMFGVVDDEHIYLKTDADTRKAFDAEGVKPFTFTTKEKGEVVTSYCELPERLYDDKDELVLWARRAHEVALRSGTARRRRHKTARDGARQPKRH